MKKADRTKAFIIEKVAPIFNKKGVYGTSLSDMTSATGLTKGAIYGNFGSKDALAMACFEFNLRFLQKGLYKSIAINGNAIDKLSALVTFYQHHYRDVAENGGCPLMNSAIETDDAHPLLKEKVQTTFDLWRKEIITIVIDSQRKMEVSPMVDPSSFANTFIALLEGGILVSKTLNAPEYFNEVTNSLQKFIESNLAQNDHA
ncbi:TetR/AcrR family transcriptional regulator [Roseivirga sp. E12]|uniref:TetR/AcrR family transcriptional regulator n=1 Tax=Roseivirga sp. E12 TaxID=2819237 RepID=UPI001ABD22CF|nr:TetR/AcrR family transcriptional regulator [Roseivirga sp. E12]MBO3698584.1 TetR/AcrR family transcriptional regulator [Roseivirga sp. E12]